MIITSSIIIVEVGQLWQISHSFVRLLQHRNADSHIIRRTVVFPIFIPQILIFYVSEQLCVKGTQMAGNKGEKTKFILVHNTCGEGSGVSNIVIISM